jgi:hypothetical protein
MLGFCPLFFLVSGAGCATTSTQPSEYAREDMLALLMPDRIEIVGEFE